MNSTEHLFLLRLMLSMDWIAIRDVKPTIKPEQRTNLIEMQLVEMQRVGRCLFVRLTDRGWLWCSENLQSPLSVTRNNAAKVLEDVLCRLGNWLREENIALAEFMTASKSLHVESVDSAEGEMMSVINDNLRELIEETALAIGNGNGKVRVRLAELRERLPQISQVDLDRALLQMSIDGRLHLMSLDNPYEIAKQDVEAALYTPSGEVRHLLYWAG